MRRTMIRAICMMVICMIAFAAFPINANAAGVNKHHIYYNLQGGYTFWKLKPIYNVKNNGTFRLDNQTPQRDWYNFDGYVAYRMKDGKWHVNGKGWVKGNWTSNATRYYPGKTYRLDSSWTRGTSGLNNSNFKFYAQWKPRTFRIYFNDVYDKTQRSKICTYTSNVYTDGGLWYSNGMLDDVSRGWNLARKENGVVKWYVGGKGWQTQANINKYKYTKKKYYNYTNYKMDSSWMKGCTTSDPGFRQLNNR